MDIPQSFNSTNTDEENDWPNQIPIIPIKGFLSFWGMLTSTLKRAKTATKKAGPKTHGNGNNNILNAAPPNMPINIVLKTIFAIFIKFFSKKILISLNLMNKDFYFT